MNKHTHRKIDIGYNIKRLIKLKHERKNAFSLQKVFVERWIRNRNKSIRGNLNVKSDECLKVTLL